MSILSFPRSLNHTWPLYPTAPDAGAFLFAGRKIKGYFYYDLFSASSSIVAIGERLT